MTTYRKITYQEWRELRISPDLDRTYSSHEFRTASEELASLILSVGDSFDALMKLGIDNGKQGLDSVLAMRSAFRLGASLASKDDNDDSPANQNAMNVKGHVLYLMNSAISDYYRFSTGLVPDDERLTIELEDGTRDKVNSRTGPQIIPVEKLWN